MLFSSAKACMLFALIFLLSTVAGRCDEAVDLTGRRYSGHLQAAQEEWVFAHSKVKLIPVKQLAFVRFERTEPLPVAALLSKTFVLPAGQRLTGSLIRIDDKTIELR